MFRRRHLKEDGLNDNSGIKKWLFGASVFVAITFIWIGYFVSTQYLGKNDAVISGTILYEKNPVIDVSVSIGKEEVVTDKDGKFILSNILYGNQILKINKEDYLSVEKKIFVWKKKYDSGKINIEKDSGKIADFFGKVLDSFSKKSIENAVVIFGTSNSITNSDGEFAFKNLAKGGHILKISAIGYQDLEQQIDLGNDGGVPQEFLLSPYGKISFTSSRDGKMNIYSVGYDGKNLKNYTADVKGDCWNGKFNADGKKLVFYSNVGDKLDQWGQKITNLYFINIDSNGEKTINHSDIIPEDDYRISQEGDRVLFLGVDSLTDKKELYIASIGVVPEWIQLTDNDVTESNFDISPDGKMVVFGAFEEGERKIFLMNVDGREMKTLLTGQAREGVLRFSPDSKTVLYTMEGYDLETKVFLYDIAENQAKQIYRNVAGIKDLVWSADGSKIAFIASRDDRNYIYSINSDGKNEIQLLEASGNYDKLVWPPIEKILIVKMQEGDGKSLAVIDLTQRKIQKVENISNDAIGWQKN